MQWEKGKPKLALYADDIKINLTIESNKQLHNMETFQDINEIGMIVKLAKHWKENTFWGTLRACHQLLIDLIEDF